MWTFIDRQWVEYPTHTVRREYDFPVVGRHPVYLNGHDELHSLATHIDANSIRFWMGFGDHYINVFTVLRTLGLLSHEPVRVGDEAVIPLQVVKAVLPDPQTLAADYTGKTCIGNIIIGQKDGRRREMFIYQITDHAAAYQEVRSQGISYTAGVPPIATARLIASGEWDARRMVNVEELDPTPFIRLLDQMGLPTDTLEIDPAGDAHFDGTVGPLAAEMDNAVLNVRISAADPMIAVRRSDSDASRPDGGLRHPRTPSPPGTVASEHGTLGDRGGGDTMASGRPARRARDVHGRARRPRVRGVLHLRSFRRRQDPPR